MTQSPGQLNLAAALKQHLESLRDLGVSHLPGSDELKTNRLIETLCRLAPDSSDPAHSPTLSHSVTSETATHQPVVSSAVTTQSLPGVAEASIPYGASLEPDQRQSQMAILETTVSNCTRCPELCANRTQTVFGVGNLAPRLVFLGEGPGAEEDRQGEPFVGTAGQLLNKIIGAMKLKREEVYILNTVKCRPPGNRNPAESELGNCWGYAVQQLEILQPEFICCLGSIAARTLLKTQKSIGRMRGSFYEYRGSQVVVTYHPAYLLRTPSAKVQVWDDMKMLMAEMGTKL